MKHYIYILFIFLSVGLFCGCERDLTSEGVSKITNYVQFTLTNGSTMNQVPKGQAFVDPGYKAMEGSNDITSKVVTTGTVDVNTPGIYSIKYTATNVDGFSSSATRKVLVYDPAITTDISGAYKSNVSRVAPARAFTGLNVSISKIAPGVFYVSDFLGGFYDQGSAYKYGPDYAMTGYMILKADNTLSVASSHLNGWGDSLNSFSNGVYNTTTKAISWSVNYTSSQYVFNISLTPAQ